MIPKRTPLPKVWITGPGHPQDAARVLFACAGKVKFLKDERRIVDSAASVRVAATELKDRMDRPRLLLAEITPSGFAMNQDDPDKLEASLAAIVLVSHFDGDWPKP